MFEKIKSVYEKWKYQLLLFTLLAILSALSMFISAQLWNLDSFWANYFSNLAVTFISFMFAIFIIDYIIKKRESLAWRNLESFINTKITTVADHFYWDLIYSLSIDINEIDKCLKTKENANGIVSEVTGKLIIKYVDELSVEELLNIGKILVNYKTAITELNELAGTMPNPQNFELLYKAKAACTFLEKCIEYYDNNSNNSSETLILTGVKYMRLNIVELLEIFLNISIAK